MSIRAQTSQVRKLLQVVNKKTLPELMCWNSPWPGVKIPGLNDNPSKVQLVRRAVRQAAPKVALPIISDRAIRELDYCTELAIIVRAFCSVVTIAVHQLTDHSPLLASAHFGSTSRTLQRFMFPCIILKILRRRSSPSMLGCFFQNPITRDTFTLSTMFVSVLLIMLCFRVRF